MGEEPWRGHRAPPTLKVNFSAAFGTAGRQGPAEVIAYAYQINQVHCIHLRLCWLVYCTIGKLRFSMVPFAPDASCSGEGDVPMVNSRAFVRTVLGAAVIGGFVLTTVPPATAALYSPQQALSQQAIQQFLSNPAALLDQYPHGGAPMIAAVRDPRPPTRKRWPR